MDRLFYSVSRRLISDQPIGMLCSGGLDSSILYQIITRYFNRDIHVFHFENEEQEYLDLLNIPSDKLTKLDIDHTLWSLQDVLRANESPIDLGSMVPQYLMAYEISRSHPEIKVLITGDGADELFCGYRRCQEHDTREYDMEELKWYHNPRLDKMNMHFTIEQRAPYQDDMIVKWVQNQLWKDLQGKKPLKEFARELKVPAEIINRPKLPLKSKYIKSGKKKWQEMLRKQFIKYYFG